jgi:cytochrome c-type biogenesis protein CcmE
MNGPLGADVSDGGEDHTNDSINDNLDLTPRSVNTVVRKKRKLGAPVLLAMLLLAGGLLVFQFLTKATVFFCEADKAGVTKDCAVGKRFRLLGTVDKGSVKQGTPLRFTVTWMGSTIPVTYEGDPGGIFCENSNVAVEGRYAGPEFAGDRILVKHDEGYVKANPGRIRDVDCGTAKSST